MNDSLPRPDVDRVDILGVQIDAIGIDAAIAHIIELGSNPNTPACYVVKPYVEFLDRASHDERLQSLLNGAHLSLPDGVAAIWAAHYLYAGPHTAMRFVRTLASIVARPHELTWPLPERIAGINFTWPLLQAAAAAKLKVYLVGQLADEDIARTARTLMRDISGLDVVGMRNGRDSNSPAGTVSDGWTERLANNLRASRADLVLVGMGFPLQERVISELAGRLEHGVLIGEGGTFDYKAFGGERPKAPARLQSLGLEWLWRLVLEPRRVRRQLAVPRFIYHIWKAR